ncbi:uncharacterized protein LOC106664266 isoform X2 [Cimex lectularius]|uniref:D-isomer specific 2-hydroxyacid dehydrogenase NAD-binding domain-containing protein n=1 Tax=Cimex lectularius TaxID=79782 RepID=A0A8I6RHU0_CIMLE|nr:uncharacterized protein LOC106664266 isoform X2 [Cimex lectularius]
MAVERPSVALFSRVPMLFSTLKDRFPKLVLQQIKQDEKNIPEKLNSADVVIADFDAVAPYLFDLTNVKWLQGTWAGIEPVIKAYNKRKETLSYPIVRFSGQHFGHLMSEYVVSQIVAFERDFKNVWQAQKLQCWRQEGKVRNYNAIGDMKVTILGVGNIGAHVAKVLKCLGAEIFGLGKSDVIINILPSTDKTLGLLNVERLSKCKGALFVNIGRGSITTESCLLEALESGFLRGAILDVFTEEPLAPGSPLWTHPQVVITPHVAGVTRAKDVADQFAFNLKEWEAGRKLPNCVNFEKGY